MKDFLPCLLLNRISKLIKAFYSHKEYVTHQKFKGTQMRGNKKAVKFRLYFQHVLQINLFLPEKASDLFSLPCVYELCSFAFSHSHQNQAVKSQRDAFTSKIFIEWFMKYCDIVGVYWWEWDRHIYAIHWKPSFKSSSSWQIFEWYEKRT